MATATKRLQLRDRNSFVKHLKLELQIVLKEWKVLLPCVVMQYVHGIFHNVAYWIQANKLSNYQRETLYDLGFALMPELTEHNSHWSEYLVFGGVFAPMIICALSVPLLRQNPKKPRFLAIILKRVLLQLSIALAFRICSFLVTALPSPAPHCRLKFDDVCLAKNPSNKFDCVIPNEDFKPPTMTQLFLHMDALNGCGDLMFSSHTIYTLSFILTLSKYWPYKIFIGVMLCIQTAIAFLIVAARKHYSLDVFTALYVVPFIWFLQEAYIKDINHKDVEITPTTIRQFYDIDVSEEIETQETSFQVVEVVSVAVPIDNDGADVEGESNAPFQRKNSM